MKKIILIIILLLIETTCLAYDWKNFYTINNWNKKDIIFQSSLVSLAIVDYCYSLDIFYNPTYTKHGREYEKIENNPIIGHPPTRTRMLAFGIISLSLHTYITNLIPHGDLRTFWQSTFILLETANILKFKQIKSSFRCFFE